MTDWPVPFKHIERNRDIDQNPFIFPSDSPATLQYSRRVRWPHERHSSNALDSSAANNPMSIIVFPRSEAIGDSEIPHLPPVPTSQSTDAAEQSATPITVNETAIQSELVPMIYIDDDGVFQVKFIPKGESVSLSNADQRHRPNFTSINGTKAIAIISNDNQQIRLDQHIRSETHVVNSTVAAPSAPIDLVQDHTINNRKPMHQHQHDAHTKSTSPRTIQQQQQERQPNQLSDDKNPALFNEHPIFV